MSELMTIPAKIRKFLDECKSECETSDSCYDIDFGFESFFTRARHIDYKGYDGFIPFTNGGYDFFALTDLSCAIGSGSYPDSLSAEMDKQQEQCVSDFKSDYPEHADNDEYYNLSDFHEYEQSYLSEGAAFSYNLRVMFYAADNHRNVSGKDEILLLSGYNLDYDYLRDKGLQVLYSKNIPVQGLTLAKFKKYMQQAIDAIK